MILVWLKKIYWFCRRNKNRLLTDVVVISFPKSGRTWLRVMLSKYFSLQYNHEFVLNFFEYKKHVSWKLPYIFFHHAISDDLMHVDKCEIQKRVRAKVVFLVRDPRDVVVSYYFQITQRQVELKKQHFGDRQIQLSEFIRHEKLGICAVITYMNSLQEIISEARGKDYLLVSYERLKTNGEQVMKEILEYAGVQDIDDKNVHDAYAFAGFENMKKMEKNKAFTSPILQPGDTSNPDSYKVRKGKVGGYLDYFTPEDKAYANQQMEKLNQVFGYQ